MQSSRTRYLAAVVLVAALYLLAASYLGLPPLDSAGYPDLAGEAEGPAEQRYANPYEFGAMEPPTWIPEEDLSIGNHDVLTYEVTRYPARAPTSEQLDAAWELYDESYESAEEKGWFDYDVAVEDGYRMETPFNHFHNVEDESIYSTWGEMDPDTPPTLMYYEAPDGDGKVLVGFMYHQPVGTDVEGEQVGGPLTTWHYHPMARSSYPQSIRRFVRNNDEMNDTADFFDVMGAEFETVEEYAEKRDRTAEMMHVWFIEHPEGPFSTNMAVPSKHIEQPEKMTEDEFKQYAMREFREHEREGRIVEGKPQGSS